MIINIMQFWGTVVTWKAQKKRERRNFKEEKKSKQKQYNNMNFWLMTP